MTIFPFSVMQIKNIHNHFIRSFSQKRKMYSHIFSISRHEKWKLFPAFLTFFSLFFPNHTHYLFFMNLNYHYHTLFALELNWWLHILCHLKGRILTVYMMELVFFQFSWNFSLIYSPFVILHIEKSSEMKLEKGNLFLVQSEECFRCWRFVTV